MLIIKSLNAIYKNVHSVKNKHEYNYTFKINYKYKLGLDVCIIEDLINVT